MSVHARRRLSRWLPTFVALAVALPALAQQEVRSPTGPPPGRTDDSPEALSARVIAAVDAGNLENALYAYRSLVHVSGREDAALLGRVARLLLDRDMRTGKGWLRISATEFFAREGDAEAVRALRAVLDDEEEFHSNHRVRAMKVLAEIGDKEIVPRLQRMAYDDERTFAERFAAAAALLDLGDVSGALFLTRSLTAPVATQRLQAARLLGDKRVPVADQLRRVAREADEDLRFLVLRALALQGDAEGIAALKEEFGEDPELVITKQERSPEEPGAGGSTGFYVDAQSAERLHRIGQVLLELGDPTPVEFFTALVRHPDAQMDRGKLAADVLPVDPERGEELLLEALASPVVHDRVSAAEVLAELGRTEGLVAVLRDAYRETREADQIALRLRSVRVLIEARLPGSEEVLLETLDDPSEMIRLEAAAALAVAGHQTGLRELRKFVDGHQRINALKAAEALTRAAGVAGPEASSAGQSG